MRDCFVSAEVDTRRCDVAQTFVVSFGIVVIDEGANLTFKVIGQIVVLQ
jgi:hypothetical protein